MHWARIYEYKVGLYLNYTGKLGGGPTTQYTRTQYIQQSRSRRCRAPGGRSPGAAAALGEVVRRLSPAAARRRPLQRAQAVQLRLRVEDTACVRYVISSLCTPVILASSCTVKSMSSGACLLDKDLVLAVAG